MFRQCKPPFFPGEIPHFSGLRPICQVSSSQARGHTVGRLGLSRQPGEAFTNRKRGPLLAGAQVICGNMWYILYLVGGLEHEFYDFPYVGKNHPN